MPVNAICDQGWQNAHYGVNYASPFAQQRVLPARELMQFHSAVCVSGFWNIMQRICAHSMLHSIAPQGITMHLAYVERVEEVGLKLLDAQLIRSAPAVAVHGEEDCNLRLH